VTFSSEDTTVTQRPRNSTPLTLFAVFLIVAIASAIAYLLGRRRGSRPPAPPAPRDDPPDRPWSGPA
jgi:CDP-diglyceride synthetase